MSLLRYGRHENDLLVEIKCEGCKEIFSFVGKYEAEQLKQETIECPNEKCKARTTTKDLFPEEFNRPKEPATEINRPINNRLIPLATSDLDGWIYQLQQIEQQIKQAAPPHDEINDVLASIVDATLSLQLIKRKEYKKR